MKTTIYYKLERLPYGSTRRYASTNRNIVERGALPLWFQIYGKERSVPFIINDTKNVLQKTYGQDIELIDISVGEDNK